MKKLVLVVISIVAVLVAALPAGAQDLTGIEFKGDDNPEALKKILGYYMGAGQPSDQDIVVWVGTLPDDLEIPLPENAIVVGAVEFDNVYYPNTRVFLESDMTPENVMSFFEDNLDGYEVSPNAYAGPTGFVDQNYSMYNFFCQTDGDSALNVNVQSMDTGVTTLFVDVVPAYGAPCQNVGPQKGEDVYRLLPILTTPEGVSLVSPMGGGGGGGGRIMSASSDALLQSNLPLAEIADAYNAQLEAAGWQSVAQDVTDIQAVSTWIMTDEEDGQTWNVVFTLITSPNAEGEYWGRVFVATAVE